MIHDERVRTALTLREARGRLCRYLQAVGYRVAGGDLDVLFERTKALGQLPGSPPRTWPSRIFVNLGDDPSGSVVTMRWEISTKGKVVSIWDVSYFKREIQAAVRTVAGKNISLSALEKAHLNVSLRSLGIYVAAFLTFTVTSALVLIGEVSLTIWLLALFIVAMLILATRAPMKAAKRG